ncbi:hypothetical protein D9M73_83330 [compost metagenome]
MRHAAGKKIHSPGPAPVADHQQVGPGVLLLYDRLARWIAALNGRLHTISSGIKRVGQRKNPVLRIKHALLPVGFEDLDRNLGGTQLRLVPRAQRMKKADLGITVEQARQPHQGFRLRPEIHRYQNPGVPCAGRQLRHKNGA